MPKRSNTDPTPGNPPTAAPRRKLPTASACTHALTSCWPDLNTVPAQWRNRTRCAFCGALDIDPESGQS